MIINSAQISKSVESQKIKLRPNSNHGFWVPVLVPAALIISLINFPLSAKEDYKITTVLSVGIFFQQLATLIKLCSYKVGIGSKLTSAIPSIVTSSVLQLILGQNWIFAWASGFGVTLIYTWINRLLLINLPKSFTLGEASLVSQGLTLFLFKSIILHLPYHLKYPTALSEDPVQCLTNILEVGVLCILALIVVVRLFSKAFRSIYTFVPLLGGFVLIIISCPVTTPIPIFSIIEYILGDQERIFILLIYAGLLGITGSVVQWQIYRQNSTSTSIRKLFHILIVAVFIVGLLFQVAFLYVASGVIFAIFLLLETIRVLELEFVGPILNGAVAAFVDDKDCGKVALTPIYLLTGCALPLYLHPLAISSYSDPSHQLLLPLMAGVLSIGVGDMFAGVCGSKFGRHKWNKSQKSIEGTVANIVSQCLTVWGFAKFGLLSLTSQYQVAMCLFGIVSNAVLEAKTDQVDNLVVPIFTYIVFSLI